MNGDISSKCTRVLRECAQLKYPKPLDEVGLRMGDPVTLLPILHFTLLKFSRHVALCVHKAGYELHGKTDQKFVENAFRLFRDCFGIKTVLAPAHFLEQGFAERKLMLISEVVQACKKIHNDEIRKERLAALKTKQGPGIEARLYEPSRKVPEIKVVKNGVETRQIVQAQHLQNATDGGQSLFKLKRSVTSPQGVRVNSPGNPKLRSHPSQDSPVSRSPSRTPPHAPKLTQQQQQSTATTSPSVPNPSVLSSPAYPTMSTSNSTAAAASSATLDPNLLAPIHSWFSNPTFHEPSTHHTSQQQQQLVNDKNISIGGGAAAWLGAPLSTAVRRSLPNQHPEEQNSFAFPGLRQSLPTHPTSQAQQQMHTQQMHTQQQYARQHTQQHNHTDPVAAREAERVAALTNSFLGRWGDREGWLSEQGSGGLSPSSAVNASSYPAVGAAGNSMHGSMSTGTATGDGMQGVMSTGTAGSGMQGMSTGARLAEVEEVEGEGEEEENEENGVWPVPSSEPTLPPAWAEQGWGVRERVDGGEAAAVVTTDRRTDGMSFKEEEGSAWLQTMQQQLQGLQARLEQADRQAEQARLIAEQDAAQLEALQARTTVLEGRVRFLECELQVCVRRGEYDPASHSPSPVAVSKPEVHAMEGEDVTRTAAAQYASNTQQYTSSGQYASSQNISSSQQAASVVGGSSYQPLGLHKRFDETAAPQGHANEQPPHTLPSPSQPHAAAPSLHSSSPHSPYPYPSPAMNGRNSSPAINLYQHSAPPHTASTTSAAAHTSSSMHHDHNTDAHTSTASYYPAVSAATSQMPSSTQMPMPSSAATFQSSMPSATLQSPMPSLIAPMPSFNFQPSLSGTSGAETEGRQGQHTAPAGYEEVSSSTQQPVTHSSDDSLTAAAAMRPNPYLMRYKVQESTPAQSSEAGEREKEGVRGYDDHAAVWQGSSRAEERTMTAAERGAMTAAAPASPISASPLSQTQLPASSSVATSSTYYGATTAGTPLSVQPSYHQQQQQWQQPSPQTSTQQSDFTPSWSQPQPQQQQPSYSTMSTHPVLENSSSRAASAAPPTPTQYSSTSELISSLQSRYSEAQSFLKDLRSSKQE